MLVNSALMDSSKCKKELSKKSEVSVSAKTLIAHFSRYFALSLDESKRTFVIPKKYLLELTGPYQGLPDSIGTITVDILFD